MCVISERKFKPQVLRFFVVFKTEKVFEVFKRKHI